MFGKMKNMMSQMKLMQEMMKDENFRAFMNHSKVQDLFKDSEFQAALKSQDPKRIASHPKMMALQKDQELAAILKRMDPEKMKGLFGAMGGGR